MSRSALQPQHQPILQLILKFLNMLSKKDLIATKALLDDSIQLFLEVCLEILAELEVSSSHKFLSRFSRCMHNNDRNTPENSSVICFECDQERSLFITALCSISSCIVKSTGHIMSDQLDISIWRQICFVLVRGNACMNQESRNSVMLSCLRLMLSISAEIQVPRTVSEQVWIGHPDELFDIIFDLISLSGFSNTHSACAVSLHSGSW